jgi:hypothetical protein
MPSLPLYVALATAALITACVMPARQQSTRDEAFVPRSWKTVAVLPFAGDAAFRRPAGEFFAYKLQKQANSSFTNELQKQQYFQIVPPGFAETVLERKGQPVDAREITVEQAQKLGQMVEAQAVLIGNITLVQSGAVVYVRAEIKLIDVSLGKMVASVDQPSPLLSYDGYPLAHAAVTQAAAEMKATLESFGKKVR